MKIKRFDIIIIYLFFVLFIFSPRTHFFQIPNSPSDLRLDIIMMLLFMISYFVFFLINNKILSGDHFFWTFIFFLVFTNLIFITVSRSIIYAVFQSMWYISILTCFFLAKEFLIIKKKNQIDYMVTCFIFLNVFMHLISLFLKDDIFGFKYGLFEIPSPFALVTGIFALFVIGNQIRIHFLLKLVLIISLVTAESRIVFGSLLLSTYFLVKNKIFYLSILSIFPLISLSFLSLKAVSIYGLSWKLFLADPSLLVRYFNFVNMVEWFDLSKIFFGGGVLSFLEYSIQYGKPGHLDVLYLKLISDYGIITCLIFIFLFIRWSINSKLILNLNKKLWFALLVFLFIYNFFNEGLVSIKSGHFIFFLFGLQYWYNYSQISFRKY